MWGRAAEAEALALEIQGTEFLASCGADYVCELGQVILSPPEALVFSHIK